MSTVIERAVKADEVYQEAGEAILKKLASGQAASPEERRILDRLGFNEKSLQVEIAKGRSIAMAQRDAGFNGALERIESGLADAADAATVRGVAIDKELVELQAKIKSLETEKKEVAANVASLQSKQSSMLNARQRLRESAPADVREQVKRERLELFDQLGRKIEGNAKKIVELQDFERNYERPLWGSGYCERLADGHPCKPQRGTDPLDRTPFVDVEAWNRHVSEQLKALVDTKTEQLKLQAEHVAREKEINDKLHVHFLP